MEPSAPNSDAPADSPPKKVARACQRCRRQKLKCDIQRPCILCVRAGVDCSVTDSNNWRVQGPCSIAEKTRRVPSNNSRRRHAKRIRPTNLPGQESQSESPTHVVHTEQISLTEANADSTAVHGNDANESNASPAPETVWASTSAAMTFVEEAFHHHDTTSPDGPETSAFTASQWVREKPRQTSEIQGSISVRPGVPNQYHTRDITQTQSTRLGVSSPVELEFRSLLPEQKSATLLVDNYFERIHWFMLVFHQSDFREKFRHLYGSQGQQSTDVRLGLNFLSVYLAVCLISLRYTSADQRRMLTDYGVEPAALQERLLSSLRMRLLDIVSLGSIEAVQTCILLGSFYLYHGAPELAWPICGCGLRIAQALNLHRRAGPHDSGVPDLDDPIQRAEETRKRCWWAVYEIETFCSMLYGFPLSISDGDCDIEILNPYASRSRDPTWEPVGWQVNGQATLLSYKRSMAQLSRIVKSALVDLYGLHQKQSEREGSSVDYRPNLQDLVVKVTSLDGRLHSWFQDLPKQLQLGQVVATRPEQPGSTSGSNKSTGTSERDFERSLFELQALALKLAFENARILVHRPLLSYRTVGHDNTHGGPMNARQQQTPDPFEFSIRSCRDAALQISHVGSRPIVREAADTYAVSFISLHLFTAGVALSIMASFQPLSQESQEAKLGLRRLMEIQSRLKSKSIVAEQGFDILKKLMALIMTKETEKMLQFDGDSNITEQGHIQAGEELPSINISENPEQDPYSTMMDQSSRFRGSSDVPAPTDIADSFGFYEDPLMTQALLEFEQVMTHLPNPDVGNGASVFDSHTTASCFNSQDRGWIWGSNYRLTD